MAAKELGIEAVPVIHLDALTDEQRRAYTHIHNQLTMNTGWDYGKLNLDLSDLDFDFKKFGFAEEFSFNAIDNLLDEDFVSLKDRADAEFYNITFSFPAETKELVTSYVKDRGKEKIVDSIVEEAQKWE